MSLLARAACIDMRALKLILVIFLGLIATGSAEDGSNPATVLDEQTKRRRQEELTRVGRDQRLHSSQFKQQLRLFDRRSSTVERKITDQSFQSEQRSRLKQSLGQIRQKERRQRSHLEQTLNNLKLSERKGDLRQKQQLNRLRDRQRSASFVRRQKIRQRRNSISKPASN